MTINIHATVSDFSFPYFEYMKENYISTSKKHSIKFYCYCLDSSSFHKASGINNLTPVQMKPSAGTTGHCNAVGVALRNLKNTEPGSIDIIADVDTVMLIDGWDIITENILNEVGVFGSSFERIGGRCSGSIDIQMYKNKPSFTWFAASKKHDFSRMETYPCKEKHLVISTQELSDLYQLPIGYKLLRDTGWQIPSYLRDNGITYKILVQEKPTDNAKVLKTGENYHEEFQLDGVPFMAHQRGSMSKAYRKHELSVKFYNTLDLYFKNGIK